MKTKLKLFKQTQFLFVSLFFLLAISQAKSNSNHLPPGYFTISGTIMDETSQETLIGATIYDNNTGKGTVSNEFGFYSLSLPEGTHSIVVSYVGYNTIIKEFILDKDILMPIRMVSGDHIKEIVVSSEKTSESRHEENSMSVNKIDLGDINRLPLFLGEPDVFKLIQLKPGVSATSESGSMSVRGGGSDQNLILLDDVPVYNANHLFGFISVFNGDAMKSAKIYKGGFPARYGGRLSSIVDVRMKDGNMKEFHGNVNLGVMSMKFNVEGPIVKDKTSFMLSGRRTFIDLITTPIARGKYKDAKLSTSTGSVDANYWIYNFYDFNAKVNHKFSEKSRLYISSFLGNDRLSEDYKYLSQVSDTELGVGEDKNKIRFGNQILAARWNYQLSPKLFSNTTLTYSKYRYRLTGDYSSNIEAKTPEENEIYAFLSETNIEDFGAKLDFSYVPNSNHYIRFGAGYVLHNFTPTTNAITIGEETEVAGEKNIKANEYSVYVEDDIKIGNQFRLNLGVHTSAFQVQKTNYYSIQPRASISYNPTKDMSVKASYSKMAQYVHLLVSSDIGLPTDLWVLSTSKIKPETSDQYALGITKSLPKGWELTAEAYYKTMDNLVEYKPGQNVFDSSQNWEDKVDVGTGKSYGLELLVEKTIGKTTGWLAYTFSRTTRTFDNINNGKTFPYKYDRTHDLKFIVTHKFSNRFDIGALWVYGTGDAYSFTTQSFLDVHGDLVETSERNNQRKAPYHRLDLSANFHKERARGKRIWSFGFYNTYNRKNPFIVRKSSNPQTGEVKLKQQSLLPIVPFIAYKRSF